MKWIKRTTNPMQSGRKDPGIQSVTIKKYSRYSLMNWAGTQESVISIKVCMKDRNAKLVEKPKTWKSYADNFGSRIRCGKML